MQRFKQAGAAIVLGTAIAACGGGTAATQPPAATQAGGGGGGATELPAATQQSAATDAGNGGNGGGGTDTSHGKAHLDIAGPISKSIDLGASPALTHFGGEDETVLYFIRSDGAEGALALTWQGGTFAAVFTSTEVTITGGECNLSNLKIEAASASGSFDCPTNIVVLGSGASAQNATFKGTFESHG